MNLFRGLCYLSFLCPGLVLPMGVFASELNLQNSDTKNPPRKLDRYAKVRLRGREQYE